MERASWHILSCRPGGLVTENVAASMTRIWTAAQLPNLLSFVNSIPDQSTTAGKINHKALRDPELFAIRSSCIDKSASKWMVSLYYEPPPSLDDLEIKNFGSRIPESGDDPIEAIFHYEGENIWVSVPYLYARTRSLSSGLFWLISLLHYCHLLFCAAATYHVIVCIK